MIFFIFVDEFIKKDSSFCMMKATSLACQPIVFAVHFSKALFGRDHRRHPIFYDPFSLLLSSQQLFYLRDQIYCFLILCIFFVIEMTSAAETATTAEVKKPWSDKMLEWMQFEPSQAVTSWAIPSSVLSFLRIMMALYQIGVMLSRAVLVWDSLYSFFVFWNYFTQLSYVSLIVYFLVSHLFRQ